MVGISNGLQGVGYGLLVLFFAMGVFQSAASFRELQRPEFALRHFIRFAGAKIAVGYAMDLMLVVFSICSGIAARAMSSIGGAITVVATLPSEITTAIEDLSFLESIPLWLVAMLGGLIVTVLSFVLILTVYGRFFRIYMYTALAPIPLASFAGEGKCCEINIFIIAQTAAFVKRNPPISSAAVLFGLVLIPLRDDPTPPRDSLPAYGRIPPPYSTGRRCGSPALCGYGGCCPRDGTE